MMSQVTYKRPSLQWLLCGLSVTGVGPVVAATPEDRVTVPQDRYTGPAHSFPVRRSAVTFPECALSTETEEKPKSSCPSLWL